MTGDAWRDTQHILSKVELDPTAGSQSATETEDSQPLPSLPISNVTLGGASSSKSLKRKKSDVSGVSVDSPGFPLMLKEY